MRTISLLFTLTIVLVSCKDKSVAPKETDDAFRLLEALNGVEVQEIDPQNGFKRQFEVYIEQPLDHNNPQGQIFKQRVFISQNTISDPVIFMPSGYSSSPVKVCELAEIMETSQIYVAHRFMAGAQPEKMDWPYLTVEQAASDFHRVVQLLKKIYKGPWISYGISKNGQSALFHRRYYPDDVEATVSIGSPISRGTEDPRYDAFLSEAGTVECRRNWLMKKSNNIIYIYGENDPWTAGAIESVGSTNAIKIIQKGANHLVE